MSTTTSFDLLSERLAGGGRLTAPEIRDLAASPDVLPLGMLADTLRRRLHAARATYVRVATAPFDAASFDVPPATGELRLTGSPSSLDDAVRGIEAARGAALQRPISGLSWTDVERFAAGVTASRVLLALRQAGLDAFAELPLDAMADPEVAVTALREAGFARLRLTVQKLPAAERVDLLLRAGEIQERQGGIEAINPLPLQLNAFRPTTGYEDVKMVAVARLAAPAIPHIQVDWLRYGPKLAQVALTFGADDLDGVSASDDAPEGRRRAALEEVRRNIQAAGFEPAERDGRFSLGR